MQNVTLAFQAQAYPACALAARAVKWRRVRITPDRALHGAEYSWDRFSKSRVLNKSQTTVATNRFQWSKSRAWNFALGRKN